MQNTLSNKKLERRKATGISNKEDTNVSTYKSAFCYTTRWALQVYTYSSDYFDKFIPCFLHSFYSRSYYIVSHFFNAWA